MQHNRSAGDNRPTRLIEPGRPAPQITTVQLATSIFCTLIGPLMLVAPHQFSGPIWSALEALLIWVGALFLLAGLALVGVVILGAPRRWVVVCHLVAAAAPVAFVYNAASIGLWAGAGLYAVLAVGVALAPFVTWFDSPGPRRGDFFGLLFGVVSATNGSIMLLLPAQFGSPIYDPIRPYLWLYGAAFVVAGLAVMAAQFLPSLPTPLYRAVHLAVLVPFLPFVMAVSIPLMVWSAILLYGVFPLLVASLPWTSHRLKRVDPRSFSARLAFALALAAAIPPIAIMGLVSSGQEEFALNEAEYDMELSAVLLASDVSHYIGAYRGAAVTLSSYPGLLDLPPAAQQAVLRSYHEAYPDALGFVTRDTTGRGIARSDGRPPDDVAGQEFFEEFKRSNTPVVGIATSPTAGQTILTMPTPVRDAQGRLIGLVGVALESQRVAALLNRVDQDRGTRVYLVNAAGRAMVHPDRNLVASFADLSSTPAVAGLQASPADHGVVSSAGPGGKVLAAYARVPDLGWAVVAERPAGVALAPVRTGRNVAFGLLLGAVVLAAAVATLMARRLAGPLRALARASGRLALGDGSVSLPPSGTSEIQDLLTAFEEMRGRLVERTAQLTLANQELEAFTYAAAHDLRAPVRHLEGFSEALLRDYADSLDERGRSYLRFVREGSEKMRELVDGLLELSRVTRTEVRRTNVDLSEIAQSLATQLRQEQPERRVEFVIAPGVVANGDPSLLRVVLDNLLGNAWKFTSKRDLARIEFGVVLRDGSAAYYVGDDGAGFQAARADKLFQPFQRLHSAGEFPGTGIGLATVERIIRRHCGEVWAEGQVDKGATFYFTLG